MQAIESINPDNYQKIRSIYQDFKKKALAEYKYNDQPIEFEDFISAIDSNLIGALVLFEDENPEGILIYTPEKHNVIEINVIHSNNRYALLEEFLNQRPEFDVISYVMMGSQGEFVRDIAHLGFKFVGQSIVKFDFLDPVSYRILKNAGDIEPGNSELAVWEDKYFDQAVEVLHNGFKNTRNANFDPRFLTFEGTRDVLEMTINSQYGSFLPSQSRVLLNNDQLEGICLAVLVSEDKVNIPLISVRKDERNKGMGKVLLKSVIGGFLRLITEKKIHLKELSATVDTDNYPAIKMYRRLGFREEYYYAHAYLKTTVL